MRLIDELIELASNDKEPIGNVLRKCLIVESQFSNDSFRAWVDRELDGYGDDDEVPSYRHFPARSYGMFTGLASNIPSQPLNIWVMKPDDRKMIDELRLFQPASSYEGRPDKDSDASIPWPVHLTTKYQESFITTHTLLRAWQSLPGSVIIALLETVRNRVLRFALDMKKSSATDKPISTDDVGAIVDRQIFLGKKFDWT
jgi:AbiTii